ncbi:MAG: hypothetical protein ACRD2O_06120, partial [Terriglobia bacterium]
MVSTDHFSRRAEGRQERHFCGRVSCALLVLCAFAAAPGFARKKKKPTGPPTALPGRINNLARQLYGAPLDSSTPLTRQIQTLILDHIQQWFASGAAQDAKSNEPLDVKVRQQIEFAFSELHYPLEGKAAVFIRPWKGEQLVGAGYTLAWPEFRAVNVLALYGYKDGKTRQLAIAHFVPRTDLRYAFR